MRLYATIKNTRKGKKGSGDDTRILLELSYKNDIVGTIGLYSIIDNGKDVGYRVVWDDDTGFPNKIIAEEEQGKS